MRTSAFFAPIFTLLVGCSSTAPISSPSAFISALAPATCSYFTRCGFYADQASCLASNPAMTLEYATVLGDVAAHTITYDATAAAECIDQFQSATCTDLNGLVAALTAYAKVFTGDANTSGTCFYNEECPSAFSCQYSDTTCDPSTACCTGTCTAIPTPVAIGGSCSSADATCTTNAYCSNVTSTCKPAVTSEGTGCEGIGGCASPLSCNLGGNSTGTCLMPAAHGAACNPSNDQPCLAATDYCDGGTMVCTALAASGAACQVLPSNAQCVAYDTCTNNVCVPLPSVGAACDVDSCLGALECTNGTCTLPPSGPACM